jgi:hypothetical protein
MTFHSFWRWAGLTQFHKILQAQESFGPVSLFWRRYFSALNIFTGAVTFNDFTLMVWIKFSITVHTTQLLRSQRYR